MNSNDQIRRLVIASALSLAALAAQSTSGEASDVCAYRRSDDVNSIVIRGFDAFIYEIYYRLGEPGWRWAMLSSLAGASVASGHPACYVRFDKLNAVLYRGFDGHIYELLLVAGNWRVSDLTIIAGAPLAASDPAAYVRGDNINSVVYRGFDNRVYELYLPADAPAIFGGFPWSFGDLSTQAGAPPAAGKPVGYVRRDLVNSVVFRGFDSHVYELSLPSRAAKWGLSDLTASAFHAPVVLGDLAQGDPAAYVREDGVNSVVYRGFDSHIHEIAGTGSWALQDLSKLAGASNPAGATLAAGDPTAFVDSRGASSVIYRGIDGVIHELFLPNRAATWRTIPLFNQSEVPLAIGAPAAYVRSDNVSQVLYLGADNHVYELYLTSAGSDDFPLWASNDITRTAASQ